MNTYRSNALAAGILLILATAVPMVGNAFAKPLLSVPIDLSGIASNATPMFAGVLLKLIGFAACPAIALALYPVLRNYNPALSLGSVVFRTVEACFYIAGAVGLLLLVALSRQAVASGAVDSSYFAHSASLLLAGTDLLGFVAAVPFFAVGAVAYYTVLYRSNLVPRWLSGWGLVSAALAIVASVLAMFEVALPMSSLHIALNLPIFGQEIVLGVWLIAKGFNPRAIASTPATAPSMGTAGATA
jgi:hypothetical protein